MSRGSAKHRCDALERGNRVERSGGRSHAPSTLILRTLNLRALSGSKDARECHPESAQLSVAHLSPIAAHTVYMDAPPTIAARAFTDIAHPESALNRDRKPSVRRMEAARSRRSMTLERSQPKQSSI